MPTDFPVAVITPYHAANREWLRECLESVQAQTHPCVHIVIADGEREPLVDDYPVQHIVLPVCHRDYGNTPRGVGSLSAVAQGVKAIAYLDADNWFSPEHIESLLATADNAGGVDVVTSARNLVRLDGSLLERCPDSDGEQFVDTNCYCLFETAFRYCSVWWRTPDPFKWVVDRVLWQEIRKASLRTAHTGEATAQYRTAYKWHYHRAGETPPEGCKDMPEARAIMEEENRRRVRHGLPPLT